MFRLAYLWTSVGLLASSSLIGCSMPRFEHIRVEKQTIETQPLNEADVPVPLVKVDLATFNGSIDVKPHDLPVVSMEIKYKAYGDSEEEAQANTEEIRCEYAVEDGVLSIKAVKPPNQWLASASFEMLIPRGCSVSLDTSNGRVSVREIEAAVAVETSNGSVTCTAIAGNVQVKTSNGTIKIEDCEGTLKAKTSNGKVSYSGRLVGDENQIQTSNGAVSIALDPSQLVDIGSDTSNGSVKCALPTQRISKESKKHFYAVVGEGPEEELVKLMVKTSNGSIRIDPIEPKGDTPEQGSASAEVESGEAMAL